MTHVKKMVAALFVAVTVISATVIPTQAREIVELNGFYVPSKSYENYTSYATKAGNNGYAIVNLTSDTNKQWMVTTVRNSNNQARGSGSVQEGTRVQFACTGTAGYSYKLGVKRAQSSTVTAYIHGSWSPDAA